MIFKISSEKIEGFIEKQHSIDGMSGEKLIITDQATGEEYVVEDLGYPF